MSKKEEVKKDTKEKAIKKKVGVVVSDKMDKTVVVRVDVLKTHPKYRKKYKVSKRYKAHNEGNKFKTGDKVMIRETRPLSRDKRWIATEIES